MTMSTALQRFDVGLPIGSLESYIHWANQIPMLTAEEERELAERLHDEHDLEAARRLVLAHLRFVIRIARGYSGYGLPQADLIQEGNIGLMKAVKRFDPKVGVRLVSFAVHWIKAEIHEFVIRNWRIVKVATTKAQRKLFFNLRKAAKRLGWFSDDEVNDVADMLKVSPKEVRNMEQRLNAYDEAYDTPAYVNDDNDSSYYSPANYLEDSRSDPAKLLETADWDENQTANLRQALTLLDARSRDILCQRWLNEDGKAATLHELAAQHNVSAERIRQLEKNAMQKLKAALT